MKRGSLFFVLALLAVLSMMRGGREVDRQAFAISIGIDVLEEEGMEVTMILPSAQSGGDGGSGGGTTASRSGGYALVSAKAQTYQDALMLLQTTVPREINFTQVLQIVISEEMAKKPGLDRLLQEIFATPRMNHSASPVICAGRAGEMLEKQKPTLGVRLSKKILFSLEEYQEKGLIPRSQLGEVVRMMSAGSWKTAVVPYAAYQQGEGESAERGNPYDLLAGNVPTRGGDQVVYLGAAVLGTDRMLAALTGEEMQYLSFAMGEMKEIEYEWQGGYYRLQSRGRERVSAKKEGDTWILKLKGDLAVSPIGTAANDARALGEAFSRDVLEVLEKLRGWGADPVGFQGKAAGTVRTLKEWENVFWQAQYPGAALEVVVRAAAGEAY